MELGNFIFGNARGEFPIERGEGFEEEIGRLAISVDPQYHDFPQYGTIPEFTNEVFELRPYYWGECTCGADYDHGVDRACSDDCALNLPNFKYKPTGLEIQWYKYPLRDSYSNQPLILDAFKKIIDTCIQTILIKRKGE